MSASLSIDRFTRQNLSISGKFVPSELTRLAEFLADGPGDEGEITYTLTGKVVSDVTGSQKRCVKCIISGWFFLADPVTLQPVRHELDVESRLVLVANESELPPLELEDEDEDYIVCSGEMDVKERVEEEILLDLPAVYASAPAGAAATKKTKGIPTAETVTPLQSGKKISPFAGLAELKKKQS